MRFGGFGVTPPGLSPPSPDMTFIQLADPRVEPALDLIHNALTAWRGQSLVAQTAVVDLLLDIQNLLMMGAE